MPDSAVPPEAAPVEVINKAVRAAGERIGLYKPGNPGFWSTFRIGLEAAAPLIAAAERERLAAVIPAADFRKLADWFDTDDLFKETMFPGEWPPGSRGDAWQRNLRRFADLIGDPDA